MERNNQYPVILGMTPPNKQGIGIKSKLGSGYDPFHDVNVYACICPDCGLHIFEFTDDDVDDKCDSGNPEVMFKSSMVHHGYMGLNNFCNRCGRKLDWGDYH